MKALTLHQPWASAIVAGLKRHETRSWATSYRGPLAIHAGKSLPAYAREFIEETRADGIALPDPMPLGAVVCIAELVACHRTEARWADIGAREAAWGDWSDGRFAWELANVRVLTPPIPARGAQGLWEWSEVPSGLVIVQPGLFDAATRPKEPT